MEELEQLKIYCQKEFSLELAENLSVHELKENIAKYINYLIQQNFNQLLILLYKIDINESMLKQLLRENTGEDAGQIIAQMIIERQLQKIQTRRNFKKTDNESGEEKW